MLKLGVIENEAEELMVSIIELDMLKLDGIEDITEVPMAFIEGLD